MLRCTETRNYQEQEKNLQFGPWLENFVVSNADQNTGLAGEGLDLTIDPRYRQVAQVSIMTRPLNRIICTGVVLLLFSWCA